MKTSFWFVFAFLISNLASGQEIRNYDLDMQSKHAEIKGYDPDYRINYFENITLKSFLNSNFFRLQYRSINQEEFLDLSPIGEYLLGISFDYKWVALEVSWAPNFLLDANNDDDLKNANAFSANLNFFYSDQFRQEFRYTSIKGFKNNRNTNLSNNPLDLLSFKDTELDIFEGNTFYIANKNFSFRAHYAQTERQLKSAGSLIPKLRYSYSITTPNIDFGNFEGLKTLKIQSLDVIGQLGYMYTFVLNKKWYTTLGLHVGAGYNYSDYTLLDRRDEIYDSFLFAIDNELSIGYNNYRWFFGLTGNWRNYNNSNNESGQFSRDRAYMGIHVGYRLNDNKPMRNFFGWFEDHLGF